MISTRSVELVIDTVVCLTLAKWETVSGQFGGYLTGRYRLLALSGHSETPALSASLIGHSGSSAFTLSTTPVSMSLAGSRFSPDSAPRPFHHGFRRRGGTIFRANLPSM